MAVYWEHWEYWEGMHWGGMPRFWGDPGVWVPDPDGRGLERGDV